MSETVQKVADEFADIERSIAVLQAQLGALPALIDAAGRELNKETGGRVRACAGGRLHLDLGAAFSYLANAQKSLMDAHCEAIRHVEGIISLPQPKSGGR